MHARSYLPSAQFSTIVGSIALAGGLILAAQYLTSPHGGPATVATGLTGAPAGDWQAALEEIQAQAPGLPEAPTEDSVAELLDAAQSSNVTATVARSLLVNLTNAGAQGLGSDIPTQDTLVAQAVAQLAPTKPRHTYTLADLETTGSTPAEQRAYGNKVMDVLAAHSEGNSSATLLAITQATDANDASALHALDRIEADYAALVEDLAAVPTPQTLAPLHVQALNALGTLTATFADMRHVLDDPLRGLGGLQQYQLKLGEAARVFTSVAEIFSKNGILFNKDEPGSAWSVFVSAS